MGSSSGTSSQLQLRSPNVLRDFSQFVGVWMTQTGNQQTIRNDQNIQWSSGEVTPFVVALGEMGQPYLMTTLGTQRYKGDLSGTPFGPDSILNWSDGDFWVRTGTSSSRNVCGIWGYYSDQVDEVGCRVEPPLHSLPPADAMVRPPASVMSHGVPYFVGKWVCQGVEGDVDRSMTELGQGWVAVQQAHMSNYGIGVAQREYDQFGNSGLTIRVTGLSTYTQDLEADTKNRRTKTSGGEVLVDTAWDEFSLRCDFKHLDGKALATQHTFFNCGDPNILAVQSRSAGGVIVKWLFKRLTLHPHQPWEKIATPNLALQGSLWGSDASLNSLLLGANSPTPR